MNKGVCGLLVVLSIVIADRTSAHPGDGLVVVDDQNFYFVATDPIQGTSSHHAAIWRWSEEKGLELVYRSPHGSSNVHIEHGLDGHIFCSERRYLGERPARSGDRPGDRDVYVTQLGRLEFDGTISWLMGPERGRRPFGRAAFLVDRDGNVLYGDAHNRLMMRSSEGRVEPLEVDAHFDDIRLMAWGPEDQIYILDGLTIKVVASDRSVRTLDLHHPSMETNFKYGSGTDGTIIFDMIVDPRRQIFLADWGRQHVLRISSQGVVSLLYNGPGNYGPEGLAFRDGALAVFESLRPRANQGVVPRLLTLGPNGEPSLVYDHFEKPRFQLSGTTRN